ncbi:threonine/serine exporter family protein [Arcanobacterium ihumii]|uniref:threonine/serine ThrE exporter family protein n=1 Tax=Arcanobacterium ihumii TaxID=2138162 RepID=UPI0022862632|nr:threonine/serine exporter family protein [Arcanobacterium ihumii]
MNIDDQNDYTESIAAHNRLAHQTHVVLRLGQYMLTAGASAYRVQDGMQKLARAVGIEKLHVQVNYTSITATAWANGTFRSEVVEQRNHGVNADKIDRFNAYIQALPTSGLMVEEAEKDIEKIHGRKPLYSNLISALASGFACAGFTFLNLGGLVECFSVFIAALIGQYCRKKLLAKHYNHFFVWMVCGFVASGVYTLIVVILHAFNLVDSSHQAGMVCAVLFLVPGFPLVTSILDLIRQDFSAGISRGAYVVMLLISTSTAVWAFSEIADWGILDVHPGYSLTFAGLMIGRTIATFIAAYGFAMLFNAAPTACLLAAFNGAFINVARLTVKDMGLNPIAAVGLAALVAGLIAHVLSRKSHYSRVTLSVPAVVVMIPGVPLYRAMSVMTNGQDISNALDSMLTLLFIITSIGFGLATARILTDHNWRVEKIPTVPSLSYIDPTRHQPLN